MPSKREDNILPYRQNIKNPTKLVGTGVPDCPKGRLLGKPQVFFENIANRPYEQKHQMPHKPVGDDVLGVPNNRTPFKQVILSGAARYW